MTEFLTENARRAYPLEHELPAGTAALWGQLLLDACIGYSGILGSSDRVCLRKVAVVTESSVKKAKLRIGLSSTSYIDVAIGAEDVTSGGTTVRSATVSVVPSSSDYKAFVTVSGPVLASLISATSSSTWDDVNEFAAPVPFAMRCISSAIKRVTSVDAYSPTLCETPVFGAATRTVTKSVGGVGVDIVLAAQEGIDIEAAEIPSVDGKVLRLSAIAAPADTTTADEDIDLVIRGDDCFTVEALPGVVVTSAGALVELSDTTSGGVIRLGTRCKACCQCSDYQEAYNALKPHATSLESIKTALDTAKASYDTARATFNAIKTAATANVNSYTNVIAGATSSCSGGVYSSSGASGTRSRIAVTLAIENMTLETVAVSGVGFSVPGFTLSKAAWSKSGSSLSSGTSLGSSWNLASGDGLVVVATYISTATTNEASKPSGMTAAFTSRIPSRSSAQTRTVTVT